MDNPASISIWFDSYDLNDCGRMEIDHVFASGAVVGRATTHSWGHRAPCDVTGNPTRAWWLVQPQLLAQKRGKFLHLSFKKYISVLKTHGKKDQPHASGRSFEVGRRYTCDVVPGNSSLQAGLWLRCVWLSVKHFSTTGQHPKLWIRNSIGSVLH